jgi:hypothetical protein
MNDQTTIYDLGTLDPTPPRPQPGAQAQAQPAVGARARGTTPFRSVATPSVAHRRRGFDIAGTLSLFVPGTGQLARGEIGLGFFFLSGLAFMASLGWALVVTLDRVTATLRLLDLPGAPAIWALSAVFAGAAMLHMSSVLAANSYAEPGSPHPVLAGVASAIVPGWGQILNGSYTRACLFIGSLWIIAAMWILSAPQVHAHLAAVRLFVPPEVLLFCSPAVRFTAPAVVWALSVYDAAATAAGRR